MVNIPNTLLNVVWVASLIYATIPVFWLAIHPFASKWRARRGKIYPLLGLIWMVCIALAGVATYPWHRQRLYGTAWAWVVAFFFFFTAVNVYRAISHEFGPDTLIGRKELLPDDQQQKLVISGIHGRIRHPIYLAHLCVLSGLAVGSGLTVVYALLLFAVVTGAIMVRSEDAELEQRFGDEYRAYKQRVPAILPR